MDKKFIIQRQGKDVVLYQGLLDEAHGHGLVGIDTTLLQIPSPENGNTAIAKARVTMHGESLGVRVDKHFDGIGDASPQNVGGMIVPHIIRMAETRAKARALRDAVNIGMVSLAELADDEPEPTSPSVVPAMQRNTQTGTSTPAAPSSGNSGRLSNEEQARVLELREAIRAADNKRELALLGQGISADTTLTDGVREAIRIPYQQRMLTLMREVG